MKKIILILVLFTTTIALSQEKYFESEVSKISKRIDQIIKTQKDSLKTKILLIDKDYKFGLINETTANTKKKKQAAYHAQRIESLVNEQEKLLQVLVQNKTNEKIAGIEEPKDSVHIDIKKEDVKSLKEKKYHQKKSKKKQVPKPTTSQFIFAFGINNVIQNHNINTLNNTKYKFWQSRFYELGWAWRTRLSKKASHFHMKYGVSFLWNNLRLEDNSIHVKVNNTTQIVVFDEKLTKSKLRHMQLIFPLHLEFDSYKYKQYNSWNKGKRIRLGVGGFVGFKLESRQMIEYTDDQENELEQKSYDDFGMNNINYGISGYISHETIGLYAKYDLNPLFQNSETRNISFGLRFDFN